MTRAAVGNHKQLEKLLENDQINFWKAVGIHEQLEQLLESCWNSWSSLVLRFRRAYLCLEYKHCNSYFECKYVAIKREQWEWELMYVCVLSVQA